MNLSYKRYEEIKLTVTSMFRTFHVTEIPIRVFDIAAKMGIKTIPYSHFPLATRNLLLKKSADAFAVLKTNGEKLIYYNDNSNNGRINHTIMHEIGHIVLKHTQDSELAEKEVCFFAKFALAPPVLIHKLKLQDATGIAQTFEISYEAATYTFSYYRKWLSHAIERKELTNYEKEILHLFSNVG